METGALLRVRVPSFEWGVCVSRHVCFHVCMCKCVHACMCMCVWVSLLSINAGRWKDDGRLRLLTRTLTQTHTTSTHTHTNTPTYTPMYVMRRAQRKGV